MSLGVTIGFIRRGCSTNTPIVLGARFQLTRDRGDAGAGAACLDALPRSNKGIRHGTIPRATQPGRLLTRPQEEWYSFLLYTLSLSFTKTSILLLYRRILPPGPSRTANHVLLALVMACNVFAVGVTAGTCVPVRAAWDERVEGRCLGEVVHLGNSILNVLTDFAIFSLPLPSVVRLKMHWRKKVGLLVVFMLGFL